MTKNKQNLQPTSSRVWEKESLQ